MATEDPKSTIPNQKSVRFSKIIDESGQPEVAVLWQDPAKDPAFQSALRQNRVMTLQLKHAGASSDFGVVGFKRSPHAEYLIFPRPLEAHAGKRIVGIKYDLISSSKRKGPALKPAKKKLTSAKRTAPETEPKKAALFQVKIRYAAETESSEEIEAPNATMAREKAIEQTANRTPDFSKAKIERRVLKVTKVRA